MWSLYISRKKLLEKINYDPETGIFRWKKSSRLAGWRHPRGYLRIRINGGDYIASHLAWLIMTGSYPTGHVYHKNRDSYDNRWKNLTEDKNEQNN